MKDVLTVVDNVLFTLLPRTGRVLRNQVNRLHLQLLRQT